MKIYSAINTELHAFFRFCMTQCLYYFNFGLVVASKTAGKGHVGSYFLPIGRFLVVILGFLQKCSLSSFVFLRTQDITDTFFHFYVMVY